MKKNRIFFPKYIIILTLITHTIACVIAKFCMLFFDVKVTGVENFSNIEGGVIFAANHTSDLDPVFIRTALPLFSKFSPIFGVARASRDYNWTGWRRFVYSNWFFRIIGAYPVPKGMHNYASSLKAFVELGKKGQTILIFIGGKKQKLDNQIRNRGGTAYLAYATNLPVVPVVVQDVSELKFSNFIFKRPKIRVDFGAPFTKESLFKTGNLSMIEFKEASSVIVKSIEKIRDM